MPRTTRRLLALIAGLIVFLIVSAVLYQLGMDRLEGKPRSFWDGLEWAAETLSTTGYGRDAQWAHPLMVVFVIIVQFAGVFLLFLIVPVVLVPFLEERFEEKLPRVAGEISNHVIVYRYGPAVETLLQRLGDHGVPSLVIETDEASARALLERQQRVVFSRAEEDALDVAALGRARAIVANGRDEENAALVLRARQMGFRGEIYAFVEEPAHRKPMELSGATSAYTPRHIIAAALAAHASDRISPRMVGTEALDGFSYAELRVPADSPLAGDTLGDARLGATVVGQWFRSRLDARCNAETRIQPGALLEVAGDRASLEQAAALLRGTLLRREGAFLIAGFGEVGRKVHELLTDAGEDVRVIERRAGPGVDIVGNVLDSSVLERAGLESARAMLLALDSDDATLFASVIARDTAPHLAVVARVNHARNLDNIHRAGADFALSISDVSGEMLSARLLGRGARLREQHRKIVAVDGHRAAGRAVGSLTLRAETGCSILAVRRSGSTIIAITPELVLESADVIYLCGPAESVSSAQRLLGNEA